MNSPQYKLSIFVPEKNKVVVPFMRDVFTIPKNSRQKPKLIGSVCRECEEYFFPKTGSKTTCDNPVCPRSTSEVLLSGKGKLLSATITHSSLDGDLEHASAVILLDEGIKINSHLIGWEGYRDLLIPGSSVELVLQDLGENEWRETQVGYAFRLVTGRKKPVFPTEEQGKRAADAALMKDEKPSGNKKMRGRKKAPPKVVAQKKTVGAPKKSTASNRRAAGSQEKSASANKKASVAKKTTAKKKTNARKAAGSAESGVAASKSTRAKAARKTTPKSSRKNTTSKPVDKRR